jgi:predicted DNA-binding transcriptional regulator YafY
LAKAVSTNTTVAITYKTPLKPKTVRKVNPYRLINYHGEWYLIGLCHTKKEIRNFAVSRITTAENLKATFTLPSEDELTNACDVQFGIMQGNKTYDVGVQFTPEAAPYAIERQWHPRQKITQNPDGTVTIHFPATHLAEVKAWILSWGRTARTTQPPELVDLLKQELAAAAANYQ